MSRQRVIIIINHIINSREEVGGRSREQWARLLRDELSRWSVVDWASWCEGWCGYNYAEWLRFFQEDGDFSMTEWITWILDYYERQSAQ